MKSLVPLLLASFQIVHSLKCHAQFSLDTSVLGYMLKEENLESVHKQNLVTQDVELQCTGDSDVCAYAYIGNLTTMKGCTASCDVLKKALPQPYEVTCCSTNMCNTGSGGVLEIAAKKMEKNLRNVFMEYFYVEKRE